MNIMLIIDLVENVGFGGRAESREHRAEGREHRAKSRE